MKSYYKYFKISLVLLDIFLFYLSLIILLFFKYSLEFKITKEHLIGFTIILPFWLLSFYSQNFYSLNIFKNKFSLRLIKAFSTGFIISILFFYFLPYLKISPKTNLFIFTFLYLANFLIFRKIIEDKFRQKRKINILVLIPKNFIDKFKNDFESLHIYNITFWQENYLYDYSSFDAIVISRKINREELINKIISKINYKVPIIELVDFYEKNLGRIPLEEIDEYWILKEIINPETKIQSLIKRIFDISFSLIILCFSLPFLPIIILGIYLNSPGPIIFKQKRIGKDNKEFTIYKLRTMKPESDLGIWEKENDNRIFFWGKILRKFHLDELPQIINVLKGELSFVGPRPEQVNIVKDLEKKIPFYNIRHIVLPGITGWTQVNYKKPFNLDETKIKVEYDFYYLKNKNFFLDLIIFLKTIFNI
ncbi:MAG: sugar transferase [Patescibacteria group bacterium]|nr:sugar transferase [Patescibacteria group bacterium]